MDITYEQLRQRLKDDYRDKILEDGWGRYRIADDASKRYGFEVSRRQARRAINQVKEQAEPTPDVGDVVDVHTPEPDVDYENQEGSAVFERPKTVDEAIEHLGINEEDWKIVRPKVGTYEGQAKVDVVVGHDDEGEPIIEQKHRAKTLYKFEFALERRHPAETQSFADKLLEQVSEKAPVYHSKGRANPQSGNMQRVLIPDLHLGKDGFQSDWGIEKATERALTVVDELAEQGRAHSVEQICLPLGHDLLHIDREHISRNGTRHTTSSGTPVERTHPWIKLFLAGCELGEKIVSRLLGVAPVHIPIIPGNHAESSEVAIGRVLMATFEDSKDVTFDLDKKRERYFEWGVNSFMDTHGDTAPWSDLAMSFAQLNGSLWGRTEWREVNTGHKHVTKTKPVGLSTNEGGAMLRISPSLSPQDAWHNKYHYHGTPGAESYIYNRERPGPFASYQRYF